MFVNLVMKIEARNIKQRYAGDSVTTTHGKLRQAFGDEAMSRAQASGWHKVFSESRTFVEDEKRSGRPSAKWTGDNTARVRELVRSDRKF
jgi:hypothetical protein